VQVASAPAPAPVATPAPLAPPDPPAPGRPAQVEKPKAPAAEKEPGPEPVETVPEMPGPVLVAAAPAADDGVGPLQSLPESVQREIPGVSFGGYIYSPDPAERLLLVDKMLRREGEEVAPGLVLERLLPKAAIMNYRGSRYRVAY
jgi:general secretion pathway protein B